MIYFGIFLLISMGAYLLSCGIFALAPAATARNMHATSKGTGTLKNAAYSLYVKPLLHIFAPFIRLSDIRKRRMSLQLARAGINLSPEEYFARSILMAATAAVGMGLLLMLAMPDLLPLAAVFAGIVFFHFHGEVKDKLKAKDRQIESELPKFIRAVVQGMKTERDVIKLLETYQSIAGEGLKYDIEVLIMDLKSGGFDDGMAAFEKRVGNSYISRLAKALISANKGDNQDSALNYLMSDMGTLAKEMMQRELAKRPGRVRMLVIPIVIVAVGVLFYVIGANLFDSIGSIM